MIIQKSKERAVCKVFSVIFLTLAIMTALGSVALFALIPAYNLTPTGVNSSYYYADLYGGIAMLLGGAAWAVLEGFTLKIVYTSNKFAPMLALGIVNAIFVITIPMSILMIIVALMECKNKK